MQKNIQKTIAQWLPEQTEQINDPFVTEGSHLIYKAEHSFTIKIQQKPEMIQTLKDTQSLIVKMVVQYDHDSAKHLKIQLTSDTEIYFNFVFQCNDWDFKRIKANQNFFIEFRQYPDFILKNFDRLNPRDKYFAVFTIFSQAEGKLNLIRKSQFKDDSIMQFDFVKASEQQIRKSIQYRYDTIRKKYDVSYHKYEVVAEVIRQKNPSLMIQINKKLKKKS